VLLDIITSAMCYYQLRFQQANKCLLLYLTSTEYYLEIDSVLTANGWKIQDDIVNIINKIDKRIKYKNRKMIKH